ncbi:MAG: hypothetical protein KDB61_01055, partial [Planctomycetes bacterium]|nr:hypothetical protein [Planctomycetota bacterium]
MHRSTRIVPARRQNEFSGSLLGCLLVILCVPACLSVSDPNAAWAEDSTGTHQIGMSTGWAMTRADVKLENGTGPLANPGLGGSPSGSSTTDLDPVFGLGLRYHYYLTNNWVIGGIFEHRIFDPESTRPLSADVDIHDFDTQHFILDLRYVMDPVDAKRRLRPYFALQLGYVPRVDAYGVVRYGDTFAAAGRPDVEEDIHLAGDSFTTAGALAGMSYLIRDGLS